MNRSTVGMVAMAEVLLPTTGHTIDNHSHTIDSKKN